MSCKTKTNSCPLTESSVKSTRVPKVNKWQVFLKEFRQKNKETFKGKSGVEVVKAAAVAYHKSKDERN